MVVKQMENPVFHRRKRESLPGKGVETQPGNREKSFEQYLIEAFEGEVVQRGDLFASSVSQLTRDNLIRLSQ
ncbi:MAG: hypothetical protein K1X75_15800 [Leptospirales bacterium]|nr:hypothetical protein [Leptospirales bacterium]